MSELRVSPSVSPLTGPLSRGPLTSAPPPPPVAPSLPALEGDHLGLAAAPAGSAQTAIALGEPAPLSAAALKPASAVQIQQAVQDALAASYAQVPNRPGESRHALNQRLHSQPLSQGTPAPAKGVQYNGAEIVVIAFEGTGAFAARQAPIMWDAAQRLRAQGLTTQGAETSLQYTVSTALSAHEGQPSNWSGLAAGPLESLLQHPELQDNSQWLSFPSEEFELLSHPSAIQNSSLRGLLNEAVGSSMGETPGINNALAAVRDIQAQARAQGKDPQFVIVSHSSGGRSAVKFLEKAKNLPNQQGQALQFPVVMTIDPVREAHEALGEAFKELINKGTEHNVNRVRGWLDALPGLELPPNKVYPPLVRHRSQPESLYAPGNVGTFLNFYQKQDTEGLKMAPRFGIQGSLVSGAQNREIRDVGTAGHGEITYNPVVTQAFVEQLTGLLPARNPASAAQSPANPPR
ncbi:MAG: hypothetical protein ACO1RX_18745 [Candidatus Sericytochromatia bacterium]